MEPIIHYVQQMAFRDTNILGVIAWHIVLALLIYFIALIMIKIGNRMIHHFLRMQTRLDERRRQTLNSLFENILKYTVYFVIILTILPLFGVNIAALLAGAGVAGLAIGFGAQTLIKDFFAGIFILFEDQYGIGDWVMIDNASGANNVTGKVIAVGMRMTSVQVWTGQIVYIPNGTILQVTNYSKDINLAVVAFNVGYETDADTALHIVKEVLKEVSEEDPNAIGDIQILGVNQLNDSTYTVEATLQCKPYSQFSVQRLAYRKLQERFLARGLSLPFHREVWMNGEFHAAAAKSDDASSVT
ncbi:MAG: mechanosensitive ion channel family protein [Acidibacillus sp.]|uniref:Small-conductance mechanosensitive channel n=1 Tax=Sulfoacidibacillus ferrooxidans TaxID=2005001 RepID=A0A9X1V7J4_9BACL|nr:mechanosensitive ion channel family protein [Sulfoacidibacillus ferrooxidans]MCI0182225.1 Small-conductance mechanosensitive channel [Sulfoacidibacillus ferrooxidans]MCY0893857.1 mechanosensitive ion channel family protein [Acidibacillus sp.]